MKLVRQLLLGAAALAAVAAVSLPAAADGRKVVHVVTIMKEIPADSTASQQCQSDTIASTLITNASDSVVSSLVANLLGTTDVEAEIVSNMADTVYVSEPRQTVAPVQATTQPAAAVAPLRQEAPAASPSPRPTADAVKASFAWGAEAGSSIDMSANDMSSIDISASFGYKRGWIKFLGIGAAMDIMVSNSSRSFPIFASFKTNFRKRPSLVFMDLRAGVAVNYLPNDYQQTGAYSYVGLGINLARGRKFSSYVTIGYTFKDFHRIETRAGSFISLDDLHMASVRLGVTF